MAIAGDRLWRVRGGPRRIRRGQRHCGRGRPVLDLQPVSRPNGGVRRALITELVPASVRATALGTYATATGAALHRVKLSVKRTLLHLLPLDKWAPAEFHSAGVGVLGQSLSEVFRDRPARVLEELYLSGRRPNQSTIPVNPDGRSAQISMPWRSGYRLRSYCQLC